MPIEKHNVDFEVEGLPQYLSVEETPYQIEQINRLKDHSGSSLVIIYREKNNGGTHEMPDV